MHIVFFDKIRIVQKVFRFCPHLCIRKMQQMYNPKKNKPYERISLMKKLALFLVSVFVMSGIAFADNDKPIQIGLLPTKAQTFLQG